MLFEHTPSKNTVHATDSNTFWMPRKFTWLQILECALLCLPLCKTLDKLQELKIPTQSPRSNMVQHIVDNKTIGRVEDQFLYKIFSFLQFLSIIIFKLNKVNLFFSKPCSFFLPRFIFLSLLPTFSLFFFFLIHIHIFSFCNLSYSLSVHSHFLPNIFAHITTHTHTHTHNTWS